MTPFEIQDVSIHEVLSATSLFLALLYKIIQNEQRNRKLILIHFCNSGLSNSFVKNVAEETMKT